MLFHMQLFALDSQYQLTAASKARKQQNYTCLECQGPVRLRSGLHRQAHFFHLKPSLTCRLSAKSMAHLQVQCYLQKALPPGDCQLEMRFPSIGRIADAAWISKKIIFEVQCSPISAEEVRGRLSDYASVGYQVVWILHDKLYNHYRLSAAELTLRTSPYYFTNMNGEGRGSIYDQFDVWARGVRRRKLAPLPIDITHPQVIPAIDSKDVPVMWVERAQSWPLHFAGDLIAQGLASSEYVTLACQTEKELLPSVVPPTYREMIKSIFYQAILRPYNLIFQLFLERACK